MKLKIVRKFPNPWWGGACFCCRRRDDGMMGGFVGKYGKNNELVWSCLDHIHLAKKAIRMPRRDLDLYEQKALLAAGAAGGQYLDSVGCTDLAQLTEVEFVTFMRTVLDTFGDALAKELESYEAPF